MTSLAVDTAPSISLHRGEQDGGNGVWPITRSLVVGRERADITLALSCLSRRHARLTPLDFVCRIEDLGSRNGTAVNGVMLSDRPHDLRHGDVIVLAGAVELHFSDPRATPFAPRLGRLTGLWTDPERHDTWIDARKLVPPLSHKQFELLRIIEEAAGRVVSREEIIASMWPEHAIDTVSNDAVDSLIKRLRRRLASIERGAAVLEIVRGRGVRLRPGR